MTNDIRKSRLFTGLAFFCAMLFFFSAFLFKLQVVDGESYRAQGDRASVTQRKVTAARGIILDRNGEVLVTNRQGNSLVFKYAAFPSYKNQTARNELVAALIELFQKAGQEWNDELPISLNKSGNVQFIDDMKTQIAFLKSADMLHLNDYATAQNCFDGLVKRYKLSGFPLKTQRDLAGVFFSMKYLQFSSSTPYVFAEDVPTGLVSSVKENSDLFTGVDVQIENYRAYPDGTLAPHILGFIGGISAEEYNAEKEKLSEALSDASLTEEMRVTLKNNAYGLNDEYGKSGIEQYMEQYLRGTNGTELTVTDSDGDVSTEYAALPEQGNTVVTTIDAGLQKVAADSLARVLHEQQEKSAFSTAGALVAIDVNTGAVRASVSYPTYDVSTYTENYAKLAADTGAPLWNRALMSTYAPGSTIKPAIALGALTEGTITASTRFVCHRTFQYLDTKFSCLDYHGSLNVEQALRHSCNIFFYNTGKELGIERMNYYCTLLGLGQKTGVELKEASGVLAGIAEREAAGGVWYPGDTIQSAIGQSDNLFTPIQLANYCATVANGKTRYKPYFIDTVFSADMSELIYKTEPEVLNETGFSEADLKVVRAGMRDVVTEGSCKKYFKDCVVQAAAKTGTSQVYKTTKSGASVKSNNGFVIAFAPYNDPQIAVVVACENVEAGAAISGAACDVFNYYFTNQKDYSTPCSLGELIP